MTLDAELRLEALLHPAGGRGPTGRIQGQDAKAGGGSVDVAGHEQGLGGDRAQGLEVTAAGRSHHRKTGGHGLDNGQTEGLVGSGGQQDRGRGHPRQHVWVVAHEVDRVGGAQLFGQRFELRPLGPASGHHQAPAQRGQPGTHPRLDGDVGRLLPLEALGHQHDGLSVHDVLGGHGNRRGDAHRDHPGVAGRGQGDVVADGHLDAQPGAQAAVGQAGERRMAPAAGEVQRAHHGSTHQRGGADGGDVGRRHVGVQDVGSGAGHGLAADLEEGVGRQVGDLGVVQGGPHQGRLAAQHRHLVAATCQLRGHIGQVSFNAGEPVGPYEVSDV